MKTKYLTSLLLLVVACSGGQTTSGTGGESEVQLKKAAAEASANHTAQGDACQEHGWYGDGECDRFCAGVDSVDCTPTAGDDGGVVCALFIEQANGVCSRAPTDPCISQDPDCDDIVCTAIAKEADGKCDTSDPCAFYQDPDCAAVDPLPPGSTPPSDPGTPTCKALPSAPDGVCSREPNDPCLELDPDCVPVACAAYIERSDGECKREPTDPCIFQDPDCHVK